MRKSPLGIGLAELATYLLDDVVEVAAGVLALDLLLDPPVGGKVRHRARTIDGILADVFFARR